MHHPLNRLLGILLLSLLLGLTSCQNNAYRSLTPAELNTTLIEANMPAPVATVIVATADGSVTVALIDTPTEKGCITAQTSDHGSGSFFRATTWQPAELQAPVVVTKDAYAYAVPPDCVYGRPTQQHLV